MLHSCANRTVRKYLHVFQTWKTRTRAKGLEPIPGRPHLFALNLQYLGEETNSKKTIISAGNAMSWVHVSACMTSSSTWPFVRATLEGLQRLLAKPTVKKEPVTVYMLQVIVKDANKSGSLMDLLWLAIACPLAICNLLWFSELICLRPCNFVISQEVMKIRILQNKKDKLRKGDELVITRTRNHTYPVAMTESYMSRTGMSWNDQRYLFLPIQRTKKSKNLKQSRKISCTCQRELFKKNIST